MPLKEWVKSHPVVTAAGSVVAVGAIGAGVYLGAAPSDDPGSVPEAPVATATVKATDPTVSATPSISESTKPSATPAQSSSAPASPTASAPAPSSPTATVEPSKDAAADRLEDFDELGGHEQEPEPNKDYAQVAEAFGNAYAAGNVGKDKWIKAMKPYTTAQFLNGFKDIDEQWVATEELDSVYLKREDRYTKVFELRFKSGLVEVVVLTLDEDYKTWKVSDFGS